MNATSCATGVLVLSGAVLACARQEFRSGAEIEPLAAFDRAADGTLFAVAREALYRSRDGGEIWELLARAERVRDVLASADGMHALVIADHELHLWREGEGLERVLPGGKTLHHFTVRAREGRLWLATVLDIAEDEETQELVHTRDLRQVGPGLRTLVFVSLDEGRTWERIAEHAGAIVQAAWFGPERVLRLSLSDGTIRGARVDERGAVERAELALLSPAGRELGGEVGSWIAFPDAATGWVGGHECLGRDAGLARTSDGGRTWTELTDAPEEVIEAFCLGGGGCVRVAGLWHPGTRVELWHEGEFQELRRFETEVRQARTDAGGGLLLRLADGEVWRLSESGDAWQRIGNIPIPKN